MKNVFPEHCTVILMLQAWCLKQFLVRVRAFLLRHFQVKCQSASTVLVQKGQSSFYCTKKSAEVFCITWRQTRENSLWWFLSKWYKQVKVFLSVKKCDKVDFTRQCHSNACAHSLAWIWLNKVGLKEQELQKASITHGQQHHTRAAASVFDSSVRTHAWKGATSCQVLWFVRDAHRCDTWPAESTGKGWQGDYNIRRMAYTCMAPCHGHNPTYETQTPTRKRARKAHKSIP
jgi:hypothetical protein